MSPPNEVGAGAPHHQDNRPTTNNTTSGDQTTGYLKNTAAAHKAPGSALVWVPCTRTYPQDRRSQLRRRRSSADRSLPLECGCREPWVCRCHNDGQLSEHALDAWRNAVQHILASGHMPAVPVEVCRALWRRGGDDRAIAERIRKSGEVA